MAASKEYIRAKLKHGKSIGASHMIVFSNNVGFNDVVEYVMPEETPLNKKLKWDKMGWYPVECYSFSLDLEKQLEEFRALHWE